MEENKSSQDSTANEKEKHQISTLRSGNKTAILASLQEIRTKGRDSILPEIFELMLISEDDEINKSCDALLCDLKSVEAVPILISAIKDKKYQSIRNRLISSCWQNGMNYSKELLIFTNILLKEDYLTAIEAFTVIENSIGDLDDRTILKLKNSLEKGLNTADEQKKSLIKELINSIGSY